MAFHPLQKGGVICVGCIIEAHDDCDGRPCKCESLEHPEHLADPICVLLAAEGDHV